MNDGRAWQSVSRPRIRTIRKGYAVGDILDEARISVTWAEGRAKRTRAPILSRVTYWTRGEGGNSVNATLVFRAFARARTWRANEAKGRRRFGGKLEEALVSLGGQRRRAVINLGRYSCTRANENRGRDRDEF